MPTNELWDRTDDGSPKGAKTAWAQRNSNPGLSRMKALRSLWTDQGKVAKCSINLAF
jgi:hypothetical protein